MLYTQDENITVPQAETIRDATGARIDYICIVLEDSRCGQGYDPGTQCGEHRRRTTRVCPREAKIYVHEDAMSAGCSQSRDSQQKGRNVMEMKAG